MTAVRVAVVQATTRLSDPLGAIDLVATWSAQAAGEGAELVVFPESFVGGYPKGSDFGAVVGRRTPDGRSAFQRYFDGSVTVPGPETDQLAQIAAHNGIHLVVGVIERDGSTLYCSVLTFDPAGTLLGTRRKLMGVAAERLLFGWGDGSSLTVYDTTLGRMGTLMCWENLMPAARMAMYAQGIQLYCAPTAVGTDVDVATTRHIAREGRCFVLAANMYLTPADFPDDYRPAELDGSAEISTSHGGSMIVGPNGDVLAGPVWDEQAVLIADIDLDDCARWKYDFDVTGHFARPDLFHLTVDRTARNAVRDLAEPVAERQETLTWQ
jgi:nitrilase